MLHLFCSPAYAGHSGPPIAGENAGVAHGHSSKRWSPKCTGKSRRFSASRSGHPKARTKCAGFRKYANRHRAYPFAKEAPNPAVTQDRCCVLAFGPGLDRKASNAWAIRIPTLRTMKNAAINSNIDGSCAIDALTKRSTFCTVKEILLSGPNFPPHDDFEQHRAPGCPPQIRPVEGG